MAFVQADKATQWVAAQVLHRYYSFPGLDAVGSRRWGRRCTSWYREAGLALQRKKREHCVRQSAPLRQYTAANQEWALDFAHDAIAGGRAIRVLSVVDAYTRECLALEVDTSFPSRRVTRVLDEIIEQRGEPRSIRCDPARN